MSVYLTNARVLLVEDSEQVALLFKRHCRQIRGCTWEINHVRDFASACAAFSEGPYDLYFFDYRLGPHHGIELIHEMQKIGAAGPVLMITGLDDESIGEQALMAGATEFLAKQDLSATVIERAARHATIRYNVEQKLQVRAREDGLTHTFNRGHFMGLAVVELTRAQRFGQHLSLIMLDIDHFKIINDEHGHAVGDKIINAAVDCCRTTLRDSDLIGRYGGDEFVILLPQTTLEGAAMLAQRIHGAMRTVFVKVASRLVYSTVSMGVASIAPPRFSSIDNLIEDADKALYQAKQRGRNRVELTRQALK